jgi:hypothetical protein
MIKFDHISYTGLTEAEALNRARIHQRYMNNRFGRGTVSLQEAVASVIDAAIEHAQ